MNKKRRIKNRAPGARISSCIASISLPLITLLLLFVSTAATASPARYQYVAEIDQTLYRSSFQHPGYERIGPGHDPILSLDGTYVLAVQEEKLVQYKRTGEGWEKTVQMDPFPSTVRWVRYKQNPHRWVAITTSNVITGLFPGEDTGTTADASPSLVHSTDKGRIIAVNASLTRVLQNNKSQGRLELVNLTSGNTNPVSVELKSDLFSTNQSYLLSRDGRILWGIVTRAGGNKGKTTFRRIQLQTGIQTSISFHGEPNTFPGRIPGTDELLVTNDSGKIIRLSRNGTKQHIVAHGRPDAESISFVPGGSELEAGIDPFWNGGNHILGYGRKGDDTSETTGWITSVQEDQSPSLFDPETDLLEQFQNRELNARFHDFSPDSKTFWFILFLSDGGDDAERRVASYDLNDRAYQVYSTSVPDGTIKQLSAPGDSGTGYILLSENGAGANSRSKLVPFQRTNEKQLTFHSSEPLPDELPIAKAEHLVLTGTGDVYVSYTEQGKLIHRLFQHENEQIASFSFSPSRTKRLKGNVIPDREGNQLFWMEEKNTSGSYRYSGHRLRTGSGAIGTLFSFHRPHVINGQIHTTFQPNLYLFGFRRPETRIVSIYMYQEQETSSSFQHQTLSGSYDWTSFSPLWLIMNRSQKDAVESSTTDQENEQTVRSTPDSTSEQTVFVAIGERWSEIKDASPLAQFWKLLELKQQYRTHPEVQYVTGLYYHRRENLEAAKSNYQKAIENRSDPRYRASLAMLYAQEGNTERALSLFRPLLASDYSLSGQQLSVCAELLVKKGKRKRAIELLKRAKKKQPDTPQFRYQLGTLYAENPATKEQAEKEYRELLNRFPGFEKNDQVRSWLEEHGNGTEVDGLD